MALVVVEVLLAALLYAGAAAAVWRHLARGAPYWHVSVLAGLGLAAQIGSLVHLSLHSGMLVIGLGTALSLFAWQAALLLWLFSLRESVGALGLVIYPFAGLCAIAALLVPDSHSATEALAWPLQLHILLSILAYGLLTLGAVQAIVLALQHRQLRRRPPTGMFTRLPALQTMEILLFRLIGAGFFLLSLAIATGALFIDDLFAQHLVHKTALSLVAWTVFAVLLYGRWRYGWRGRLAVRGALAGYALLVLAYFGSKLVLELILGQHW
ncbi:cytochrome c biogenesis protein CcsA [Salinisphaera sp.]|uniref:cytochrome C assembly family protein n=1 Tax=Salinisphaera sp. TaxID=1914330 RepID=UPI000C4D42DB|nr:cytochrome c biogenesis protein CcsA [Salinisphaera sp.]MBS63892.1 phosphohydrolase [Salinisphaera sp.]